MRGGPLSAPGRARAALALCAALSILLPLSAPANRAFPPAVRLSAEEKAFLAARPVIRVMADPNWAPVEYVDAAGLRRGLAIDVLRRIGSNLGIRFEFSPGRTWAEGLAALARGESDMASSIMPTPDRRGYLDYTRPYLRLNNYIFGGLQTPYIEDLGLIRGKRVMVIKDFGVQELLRRDYPDIELAPVDDTGKAVALLAAGKADYLIADIATVGFLIQREGIGNIKVVGETPYLIEISMAARKDREPLVGILQKALDAVPEEDMREIRQSWFSAAVERRPDWRPFAWGAAILGAVIVMTLAWIGALSARVKARTAELAIANERLRSEVEERAKAQSGLQEALEARNLVLKELNHRTKNDLMVMLSLVRLAYEDCGGSEHEILEETAGRIEAIAKMHEQLSAESMPGTTIDLGAYLLDLAEGLRESILSRTPIRLEVDAPQGVEMGLKEAVGLGLIANELITNAKKYAFPGGRGGMITLGLARNPGEGLVVTVADDGVGIEGEAEAKSGSLGTSIVRALADGMGADMDIRSAPGAGSTWRIVLPERRKSGSAAASGALEGQPGR
jgi:two-component sensor histidine kinase/ABC-type amino acid transport substrate-binding protein